MTIAKTLVEFVHDTGYGESLLMHINNAIAGKDMRAERIVDTPIPIQSSDDPARRAAELICGRRDMAVGEYDGDTISGDPIADVACIIATEYARFHNESMRKMSDEAMKRSQVGESTKASEEENAAVREKLAKKSFSGWSKERGQFP